MHRTQAAVWCLLPRCNFATGADSAAAAAVFVVGGAYKPRILDGFGSP